MTILKTGIPFMDSLLGKKSPVVRARFLETPEEGVHLPELRLRQAAEDLLHECLLARPGLLCERQAGHV